VLERCGPDYRPATGAETWFVEVERLEAAS
jgi:hypothetical protein